MILYFVPLLSGYYGIAVFNPEQLASGSGSLVWTQLQRISIEFILALQSVESYEHVSLSIFQIQIGFSGVIRQLACFLHPFKEPPVHCRVHAKHFSGVDTGNDFYARSRVYGLYFAGCVAEQ